MRLTARRVRKKREGKDKRKYKHNMKRGRERYGYMVLNI